jgi:superfamily II DNA or RNA helicase
MVTMAGGREQLRGLDWGAVAVEPYQLVPLMRVARTVRPRLLVADDTGLGKTAEAGIVLRWLAQRHQAGRVLIVTRAAPEPKRWQQELWTKFGFRFDILRDGADFAERRRRYPTINVFAQQQHLIVSMTLAARDLFLGELEQCPVPFDVVVVDEAHHLAERGSRTKRLAVLGRTLRSRSDDGALLLLTATPHDGKTETFLSLLRLLDPLVDNGTGQVPVDVGSRLVVRRLKREVTLAGGRRFLEPEIHVISTLGDATKQERALDAPLDAYLRWLAEEEARYAGAGARQKAKGCQFLAGVYRKRFGSSVAALRATLRRRLELPPAPEDQDEHVPFTDTDASDPEDEIIDPGAGAENPPPPLSTGEADLARALLDDAETVPSGRDAKLEALVRLLNENIAGEKAVVFTEYRDTLRAAARRLRSEGISFVTFHGETPDRSREEAVTRFLHDPDARIFLATDAASEGKNLQHSARHLIHLDVPWNPNRYAQRNGRIDRYGQDEQPHIWVLVAADRKRKEGRPEYRALELVVEKLRLIQSELGSVSPVLPNFSGGSVRDVLTHAPDGAEGELDKMLSDPSLRDAEHDLSRLGARNRHEIDEAEAYVAGLGTVDDFEADIGALLATAFHGWDDGGALDVGTDGIVRVRVPERLRGELGRATIDRATFRRDVAVAGQDDETAAPEFLSPAHPLVESVLRRLRDEAADPTFPHRFDVAASDEEALVYSFAVRFVDGDGRTVEERLDAVAVDAKGAAGTDAKVDLARLGVASPGDGRRPDPAAVDRWRSRHAELAEVARAEAERRAEARRTELSEIARRLWEEELEVLILWRSEQRARIDTVTLGADPRLTFERYQDYEAQMAELEAEYEARKAAVRDRSDVRVAGLELIGGRLLVGEAR